MRPGVLLWGWQVLVFGVERWYEKAGHAAMRTGLWIVQPLPNAYTAAAMWQLCAGGWYQGSGGMSSMAACMAGPSTVL